MRICIQFSWPEDADLIWLRAVTGRRFPCVIRDCVTAWADGLSFTIDTPLEVPASTPVPHESVKTILFIEDDSTAGRSLSKADGKPALIRDLLRGGAGDMFRTYSDAIWEKSREPLSVDVKISKKYADSFVSSVFRSPGDYERSLYLAVSSYVNGTPFSRDPSPPEDRPIMPSHVTVRFDRERDRKILETLSGIPEALRGCFLKNILHVAVTEAQMGAKNDTAVVISGDAPEGESGKRHIVRRRKPAPVTGVTDTAGSRDMQAVSDSAGPERKPIHTPAPADTVSETAHASPAVEESRDSLSSGNESGTGRTDEHEPVTVETEEKTGYSADVPAQQEKPRPAVETVLPEKPDYSAGEESTSSDEDDDNDDFFDLLDSLMGS